MVHHIGTAIAVGGIIAAFLGYPDYRVDEA